MSKLEQVRALFVPGEAIQCVDNTYHREGGKLDYIGGGFRGTFPARVGDVLHVDEHSATWKIGRDDHTVTYSRVAT